MDPKRLLLSILLLTVFLLPDKIESATAFPYCQTADESNSNQEIILENSAVNAVNSTTDSTIETAEHDLTQEEVTVTTDDADVITHPESEFPAENSTASAPPVPVPENPQGEFTSKAMGFYWKPSQNTENYTISWENDHGDKESLQIENDDWTCQMGRCIVYTELPSDGNYTWSVKAANETGETESEKINFTVKTTIPSADAYRPSATLNSLRPLTFEWEDIGYAPTVYRIQVAETTTDKIRMDVFYAAEAVTHINGICYLETKEYLSSGSYQWRVQGSSDTAKSEWSGWTAFQISCADCNLGTYLNTTSAVIYPNGMTTDASSRFVWKTITGALSYNLEVKDGKGQILLNEEVPANICRIENCTYEPDLSLTTGENYTWTVSAYGWNNSFWGSSDGAFSITTDTPMNDFSFIGPEANASLDPDNMQIIWTDPGVQTPVFRLGIRDESGEWLFTTDLTREDAWCDSITCSIQFHTIPEGENYEIVIIPYSEFNLPGQAATLSFSNNRNQE